MKKIGTYFKSFWQSVCEKPFIIVVFIATIFMNVIVASMFYRLTKIQLQSFDGLTTYYGSVNQAFDSAKLYDITKKSNIKGIEDSFSVRIPIIDEDEKESNFTCEIKREYFIEKDSFSQEQLENGEKVAIINIKYAKAFNVDVNDLIVVGGVEFKVIKKNQDYATNILIPATVNLEFNEGYSASGRGFRIETFGKIDNKLLNSLTSIGVSLKSSSFDSLAMISIIMGIIMLALTSINVFVAYKFISNKNTRRYTLYKVLGAKNYDISFMMILETLLILIVTFVLGSVVEHFATLPIMASEEFFAKLSALDYLALFFINTMAVFITTLVLVIKKAKAQPLDAKQRGQE